MPTYNLVNYFVANLQYNLVNYFVLCDIFTDTGSGGWSGSGEGKNEQARFFISFIALLGEASWGDKIAPK